MANYNYDFWSKEHEWKSGGMKDRQLQNQAIDQALAERRLLTDRTRAEQDRQLKHQIYNYNMSQQIGKDMDSLVIQADSPSGEMNQLWTDASRLLGDEMSALHDQFKIDKDAGKLAAGVAQLKAQVAPLKSAQAGMSNYLTKYNELKKSGNLSEAMDPKDILLAETLIAGGAEGGGFTIEDGELTYGGLTQTNPATGESEPFSIQMAAMGNLADRLIEQTDVDALMKPALTLNKSTSGNILAFEEPTMDENGNIGFSAEEQVIAALDRELNSRSNAAGGDVRSRARVVRGLLADNFGYSSEEARNLVANDLENAEDILEKAWVERAKGQYGINQQAADKHKWDRENQWLDTIDQKTQIKRLKADQRNINRLINDPNAVTFMNQEDTAEDWMDSGKYGGLLRQYAADLGQLGLDITDMKFGPNLQISAQTDPDGTVIKEAYELQGPPTGMWVQNNNNPLKDKVFIPFNANARQRQNLIKQASGMTNFIDIDKPGITAPSSTREFGSVGKEIQTVTNEAGEKVYQKLKGFEMVNGRRTPVYEDITKNEYEKLLEEGKPKKLTLP